MALHFQQDEPEPEPVPIRPAVRPEPAAPAADLAALQRRFAEMARRRSELTATLPRLERQLLRAEERLWNLERLPLAWRLLPGLIAARDQKVGTVRRRFEQAQAELSGSTVALELACAPDVLDAFAALRAAHEALRRCAGIWDISAAGDPGANAGGRAMTSRSLPRRGAGFDERTPDLPPPDRRALRFGQEDVGVVRLYPGVVVACPRGGKAMLLHPGELTVTYRSCRYVEDGRIPPDAELEDPAARPPRSELTIIRGFSARPRIVAVYGELWLHGPGGLAIGYLVSDRSQAAAFAEVYALYRATLGAPVASTAPAEPQPLRAGPRPAPAPQEELPPPEPPPAPKAAPRPVAAPAPAPAELQPLRVEPRAAPAPQEELLPPEPPPALRAAPRPVAAPAEPQPLRVRPQQAPALREELPPPEPPPAPKAARRPVAEPATRRAWLGAGLTAWPVWRVGAAASVALLVVAILAYLAGQPLHQAPVVAPRPAAVLPPAATTPIPPRTPPPAAPSARSPVESRTPPAESRTQPVERTAALRPPAPPARATVLVQARAANLRAGPSLSARIISTERRGTSFKVFAREGDWVQVGGSQPEGWIYARLLRPAGP